MGKGRIGQRWNLIDPSTLKKHNLSELHSGSSPLTRTLQSSDGRCYSVDLTFLATRPRLAQILANSFWITYQAAARKGTLDRTKFTLRLFSRFLDYRCRTQLDVQTAKQFSTNLLKEFAIWLVATHKLKRKSAAGLFAACCCFLRRAQRLYPEGFDQSFSTPRNLFAGADNDRTESRALSRSEFQKLLIAAEKDSRQILDSYQPSAVPTSPQDLIPFMIILAARTGINPKALCDLERTCLSPHELDEDIFYCTWEKPRAGKQQRQLHRVDRRNQMGVVSLIQFLLKFTGPLVSEAATTISAKLFLYLGKSGNASRVLSPSTLPDSFHRNFRSFARRHGLPRFTLANVRPTAATQLYLETGGNLRKVQQFLQHAHMRTTVNYVLNSITEPFNARVIQKAQEQMFQRITVIPTSRSEGAKSLGLPKKQTQKIIDGRYDTGCGTCRNPYDSPQTGEEKDRACTSFHACFTCPNGLWFLEDLPAVIATRDRLLSLQPGMKREDWDDVYGDSVRIIEQQVIAAFRPEQIVMAESKAREWIRQPLVVAKGILA
jgi:integrase